LKKLANEFAGEEEKDESARILLFIMTSVGNDKEQ
jgi:hypothetical protein